MFGSNVIDVAIGMIFVFLLLSLICSAANEVIEGWLKNRAIDLERGLRTLLAPGTKSGNDDLVAKLYSHPLIDGLFHGSYDQSAKHISSVGASLKRLLKGPSLPSYIPARSFALALLDTVLPAKAAPSEAAVASGATGAVATLDPGPPANTSPPFDPKNPLSALRSAVGSNPVLTDSARKALLALIDAAGQDVNKARENIEGWFNAAMDRVSGWYKRRTQVVILILGLLFAVTLNIDAIDIAKRLSTDKSLREAVVGAAQEYVKANPNTPSSTAPASSSSNSASSDLDKRLQAIKDLGLPIGWDKGGSDKGNPSASRFRAFACASTSDRVLKILGWLITALAASLGAPFWFDTLSKFIVVRSTAKPQEKTPKVAAER
jgi:hypothetical protein